MNADSEADNRDAFRECLSTAVIAKLCPTSNKSPKKRTNKTRRHKRKTSTSDVPLEEEQDLNAIDVSDFVEYLADEIFLSLPPDLRTLSYAVIQDEPRLAEMYSIPLDASVFTTTVEALPLSVHDSLCTYGLIEEPLDLDRFLDPVLTNYITTITAAPPEYTPAITSSRPPGCEICEREHLKLTYHHLIPRQVHDKAVKRGWHKDWELNKVAWLCRACHSYVHHVASNEELAKEYYDIELLLAREDVQRFAAWTSRVRWKAR